jgi:very-short-patch-repair endonuclease
MIPLGGHLAAFVCVERRVVLDLVPGPVLSGNDDARRAAFEASGWRVVNVTEAEVMSAPRATLERHFPKDAS